MAVDRHLGSDVESCSDIGCTLVAMTAGFTYFNLKRNTDSHTVRTAELRPRRLFDFVSPAVIGLATLVYVSFVAFIIYVRQFDFPWFGGYVNIAIVTAMNLFFAGSIAVGLSFLVCAFVARGASRRRAERRTARQIEGQLEELHRGQRRLVDAQTMARLGSFELDFEKIANLEFHEPAQEIDWLVQH